MKVHEDPLESMAFVTRSSDLGTWTIVTIHGMDDWAMEQVSHVRWTRELGMAVLPSGRQKMPRVSYHPSTARCLMVEVHLDPAAAHALPQGIGRALQLQVMAMSHS